MRIVELVNNLDFGGVERQVVDLATSLRARGHEVSIVCLRGRGTLADEVELQGIAVYPLEKPEGPDLGALVRLVRHLRASGAEVVHSHNPLVHHYAVIGGRLAGVGVVVNTIHGLGNLAQRTGLAERLYSLMCRFSSRIVAVCPMALREFRAGGVIPASRLVAINNGIPLAKLLDIPPRQDDGAVVFGIVGRLVPVKDHQSLLHAFALLRAKRPATRLAILGDGPLRAELEALAQRLGIADAVRFQGYSADVAGFLASVDVSVICSTSEGLPLSVLEAMAAARPIVGTAVGGIPDLIEGGDCGWLCPPGDSAALAGALCAAADAGIPDLRARGESGRRHAAESYSLERMTLEYETLFRNCAGDHSAVASQPTRDAAGL